ncbi:hypothetical protein OH77DRAFT_1248169 [Trametes cingulata]|nr:hypothetical protein OH77DRAFT_1248169 [Trametes cingulata]
MDCRPQAIDFAFTPECRAIIDVPTSETVTAADFATIIPELAAKFVADRKEELTRFICPILGEVPAGVDPLSLAITCLPPLDVYVGMRCESSNVVGMRYPAILAHDCWKRCFRSSRVTKEEFEADDYYTRTVKSLHWSEAMFKDLQVVKYHSERAYVPFHIAVLEEHPKGVEAAVERMRKIVSALGLDPMKTTFEELDACETWLRCEACETREWKHYEKTRGRKLDAYSWRGAYEHDRSHYLESYRYDYRSEAIWRRAEEEDYPKVHAAIEESSRKRLEWARHPDLRWSCSLCPIFSGNRAEIAEHLAKSHSIEDPAQAEDDGTIYVHPCWDWRYRCPTKVCVAEATFEPETTPANA